MALFPQSFIDDLRLQADIVQVVQEYVSLKRVGATYKGLCPFHGEKSPSFHVNKEKGFFHCFGCLAGGDVFKFLELQEKLTFPEAVRLIAQKLGVAVPASAEGPGDRQDPAEREALLKVHEVAAGYFQDQLAAPGGERVRQQLRERGITPDTIARLGLGFAPPAREALRSHLLGQGFPLPLVLRSGLVAGRHDKVE